MALISRVRAQLLALSAGLALGATLAFPFSVDDAYITARYATRLAHGLGYSFNDGPATDGVTGPLWLVPLVAAVKLGCDALLASKWCGLICVLIASVCCVVRAQGRAQGRRLAWTSVALCTTSLPLIVWAVAGLETGAAALAFTGMTLASTAKRAPRGDVLGISIAGAAWLRPELCFAAAACLGCTWLRSRRAALRAFAIGSASALALLAFRRLMFGDWLPLSAYAKPPELTHGVTYMLDALRSLDLWLAMLLMLFAVRARRGEDRAHACILASHVIGCVLAGGDWMPGLRLFAPMVPIASLVIAAGVRALPSRRLALLAMTTLLLLRALTLLRELPAVRFAGENRARLVPELVAQLAAKPGAVLALDIGALGYHTPRRLLDLGGLVEPQVAHARGGHLDKKIDEHWLAQQAPVWIVLHSALSPEVDGQGRLSRFAGYPVEQRVARMAFVRAQYRVTHVQRYGDAYFYVILGAEPHPPRPDFPR